MPANSYADAVFELDGSIVLVYYFGETDNNQIIIQQIDTATGKQLLSAQYSMHTSVAYVSDTRDVEGYGENDMLVSTPVGAYLFNFEDLGKEPEAYTVSAETRQGMGVSAVILHSVTDPSDPQNDDYKGGDYLFFEALLDVYVPDKKVAYTNNDGIFISELDGTGAQKVADQPPDAVWFKNCDREDLAPRVKTENTQVILTKPHFCADGKKLMLEMTSYEVPRGFIGFALLDLESGEISLYNYYDKTSPIGSVPDFELFESWDFNIAPSMVNDTTVATQALTVVAFDQEVSGRYDIIFDVNSKEVIKSAMAFPGITQDFRYYIPNRSTGSGEITFFDSENQALMEDGIAIDNYQSRGVAVGSKYGVIRVWETGQSEGAINLLMLIPEK
jgi:hypothetical protein